jgi:hypothetical protein
MSSRNRRRRVLSGDVDSESNESASSIDSDEESEPISETSENNGKSNDIQNSLDSSVKNITENVDSIKISNKKKDPLFVPRSGKFFLHDDRDSRSGHRGGAREDRNRRYIQITSATVF